MSDEEPVKARLSINDSEGLTHVYFDGKKLDYLTSVKYERAAGSSFPEVKMTIVPMAVRVDESILIENVKFVMPIEFMTRTNQSDFNLTLQGTLSANKKSIVFSRVPPILSIDPAHGKEDT